MLKTRQRWLPFFCQCRDCLETFEIEGLVEDGKVVQLNDHPRVGQRNGHYYHRCGDDGSREGQLMLYKSGGGNDGKRD